MEFGKYVETHYEDWVWGRGDAPPLSVDVVKKWVMPRLKAGENVMFLVIDCLRADQWMAIEPLLYDNFRITHDYHFSILPSATPYSRNALFSGLFPGEIEEIYPELWKRSDDDEMSCNRFERQLLDKQLRDMGMLIDPEPKYVKILDPEDIRDLLFPGSGKFLFCHHLPVLKVYLREVDVGRRTEMNVGYIESVSQWHELPVDAPSSYYEYLFVFITFVQGIINGIYR